MLNGGDGGSTVSTFREGQGFDSFSLQFISKRVWPDQLKVSQALVEYSEDSAPNVLYILAQLWTILIETEVESNSDLLEMGLVFATLSIEA